ncbi:MAG: Uma2 family endonuclease [SAR202 cluster bacterium]|nr:Uma2 family endonuclease [SAR202 cluster bacterium]
MSTQTRTLTYEAYLALPEMKQRYDIVDGVLVIAPSPSAPHQWITQEIFVRLRNFARERNAGTAMMAPLDLLIRPAPLRVRQPDILYLSGERTGIFGIAQLRGVQVLDVAPDLIVEVLSPSNSRRDIEDKLQDYRAVGVRECWLVSPEAETIEVLHLTPQTTETASIFGVDGISTSEVLQGFALRLRDVFGQS